MVKLLENSTPRHSGNSDKQLSLALSHHKDGQLDKALPYYMAVLNRPKVSKVAYLNTTPLLRSLGKYEEAISVSSQGLKVYPFDPGIYNNLGNCYLDLDRDFDAIACYRKSLSINPQFSDARQSLISLLLKNKLFHLAYATALLV